MSAEDMWAGSVGRRGERSVRRAAVRAQCRRRPVVSVARSPRRDTRSPVRRWGRAPEAAVAVRGAPGPPPRATAMAATARREIDTGEEDIAAIAKQISDHAEAIYQTWKARGLAPTEILSCRPAPGLKLAESLRAKPRPEPKPEMKQRPDVRREQRPAPEGDGVELTLPPDLVPERNPAGGGGSARRADSAAMRLEVAREEERLLRALRTGGVVAERTAERPDVVPPISLVDYAKSRYQDRLETGGRKPAAGASSERRASLGSHVTEARSKFEARARRASSAGAGEAAAAPGAAPVRPFLTRGSVAERVLMFERCPSEATLELAKRKSPAATTWRGPHDVINRAQVGGPEDRPLAVMRIPAQFQHSLCFSSF
ncbi:unnamed protein product, partial [Iphiclides podalirius]